MNTPTTTVTGHKRISGLQQFLEEIGARNLWELQGPNNSTISFYAVAGTTLIVQRYPSAEGGGFELYIPPTRSNKADETFVAARRALEVK